jgi:hypothetical protein
MKAVYALFTGYGQAMEAVLELLEQGFDQEDMNVIVQDSVVKARLNERGAGFEEPRTPSGMDRLLAGRRSVETIDMGSVYAAGQRAAIMAENAARPGGEGIAEQLLELGVGAESAASYLDGIKGGGLLFWIITDDDHAHDASEILRSVNARQVILNPTRRMRR